MLDPRAWLQTCCTRLYFDRVRVIGAERIPSNEPILYLSLHRNGATDGFVLRRVLRDPVFMISTQWTKGLRGLFIQGIAVVREKDAGDRGANREALGRCIELLRRGGALSIFPEGTSTLGPRHLVFKKGAARILSAYLAGCARPIAVIPLDIAYERAWEFRSRVEVVVGRPIDTALAADTTEDERVAGLHARITRGLEDVGVQFADEREQALAQVLAYAATLGTSRTYSGSLKALERGIPGSIRAAWADLEASLSGHRVWHHQGVPLVPIGPWVLYASFFLVTGPLALAALLLNLPPCLAGAWAGAKLPDDRNVISLWRILVGVPSFLLWSALVLIATSVYLGPLWAVGYAGLTFLGLRCIYRAKKLAVALHNALFVPSLRPKLLAFHRLVLETLPE